MKLSQKNNVKHLPMATYKTRQREEKKLGKNGNGVTNKETDKYCFDCCSGTDVYSVVCLHGILSPG